MKPSFNPKRGDVVRIRHNKLGVVDAEYLWQTISSDIKNHLVNVFESVCIAQKIKPHSGVIFDRVRFVYPVECMPDYKKQV